MWSILVPVYIHSLGETVLPLLTTQVRISPRAYSLARACTYTWGIWYMSIGLFLAALFVVTESARGEGFLMLFMKSFSKFQKTDEH